MRKKTKPQKGNFMAGMIELTERTYKDGKKSLGCLSGNSSTAFSVHEISCYGNGGSNGSSG